MATKVNMLKLLQESRGLAQLVERRPPSRGLRPLLLQYSLSRRKHVPDRRKRVVRIDMQETEDIPCAVKITHAEPTPVRPQPPA